MKKNKLPVAPMVQQSRSIAFDLSSKAISGWNSSLIAASENKDNTVSIYEPIGYDYWTGDGMTAKKMASILRYIGDDQDITVYINSPGGDMFEGLAIYNLLRNHSGKVTIKIIGIAASAASVIAMAGDEVQIARSAFLMIHNCWLVAIGNKNDFREMADTIEPFDKAMAGIYSAKTGIDIEKVSKMMDAETYINGTDAIENGFADEYLPSDQISETEVKEKASIKILDSLLAKAHVPRSERKKLMQDLKQDMLCAVDNPMPCAREEKEEENINLRIDIGSALSIANEMKGLLK